MNATAHVHNQIPGAGGGAAGRDDGRKGHGVPHVSHGAGQVEARAVDDVETPAAVAGCGEAGGSWECMRSSVTAVLVRWEGDAIAAELGHYALVVVRHAIDYSPVA
eukprot:390127-Prymnesium_polylepis.3